MNNNIIELGTYFDNNTYEHKFARRQKTVCKWVATIADTILTLSISVCTIFCMYLVYTML